MSRVKAPSAPRCAKTKAAGIRVPLVAFMGSRAENPNRQAESRFEGMEEGTQLSVFLSVRRAGSQVSCGAWCQGRAEATPRSRTCGWIPWCLLLNAGNGTWRSQSLLHRNSSPNKGVREVKKMSIENVFRSSFILFLPHCDEAGAGAGICSALILAVRDGFPAAHRVTRVKRSLSTPR